MKNSKKYLKEKLLIAVFAGLAENNTRYIARYNTDLLKYFAEGTNEHQLLKIVLSELENPDSSYISISVAARKLSENEEEVYDILFAAEEGTYKASDLVAVVNSLETIYKREQTVAICRQLQNEKIDHDTAVEKLMVLQKVEEREDEKRYLSSREIVEKEDADIEWVVDQLIPVGGTILLTSPPKTGKSFIALDLCCRLAEKELCWLDNISINADKVVYIDVENAEQLIKNRFRLLRFKGTENFNIITRTTLGLGRVDLTNASNYSCLRDVLKTFELTEKSLVVFDSLRRLFSGSENDSEQISSVMSAIMGICKSAKLILHHQRKKGQFEYGTANDMVRGSGDIIAAVDGNIGLETEFDESSGLKTSVLRLDAPRWTDNIRPIYIDWGGDISCIEFTRKDTSFEHVKDVKVLIKKALGQLNMPVSIAELATGLKISEKDLSHAMSYLVRNEEVERSTFNRVKHYKLK